MAAGTCGQVQGKQEVLSRATLVAGRFLPATMPHCQVHDLQTQRTPPPAAAAGELVCLTASSEGASEAEDRLACMRPPPAPAVLLVRCSSDMAPADSRASWLPLPEPPAGPLGPGPMPPAARAAAVSAAAARREASAAAAAAAAPPWRSKVPCRLRPPGCWPSASAPEEERRCSLLGAERQPAEGDRWGSCTVVVANACHPCCRLSIG